MKARKNRAFFIETLIVTFLLLLMLTILVRIFGAAAAKSRYAARRTEAAQAAMNVVTMFEAGEGEVGQAQQELIDMVNDEYSDVENPQTTVSLSFDGSGNMSEDGPYLVTLLMTCESRPAGYMITGNIGIVHSDSQQEDLAQLDTAKYFPDDVDVILSGDEVIDFSLISEIETEELTESDAGEQDQDTAGDAQTKEQAS